MEDLQFRNRRAPSREGMHFQWMIAIVVAMFGVAAYLFVLNFEQHRRPIPDDAALIAMLYALPFVVGVALAVGNALAILCGRRVPLAFKMLPVFALIASMASRPRLAAASKAAHST